MMGDPRKIDDRVDDALRAWREATEHVIAPPDMADAVARAVERIGFAGACFSVGRAFFFAAAVVVTVLVFAALGSVRTLGREAADYALSRGP